MNSQKLKEMKITILHFTLSKTFRKFQEIVNTLYYKQFLCWKILLHCQQMYSEYSQLNALSCGTKKIRCIKDIFDLQRIRNVTLPDSKPRNIIYLTLLHDKSHFFLIILPQVNSRLHPHLGLSWERKSFISWYQNLTFDFVTNKCFWGNHSHAFESQVFVVISYSRILGCSYYENLNHNPPNGIQNSKSQKTLTYSHCCS